MSFDFHTNKPIVDPDEYDIDLRELIKCSKTSGEFFIITCTCGFPGCAGIDKGVKVEHFQKQIRMTCSEPVEFNVLLDKSEFLKEIDRLKSSIEAEYPLRVDEDGFFRKKQI